MTGGRAARELRMVVTSVWWRPDCGRGANMVVRVWVCRWRGVGGCCWGGSDWGVRGRGVGPWSASFWWLLLDLDGAVVPGLVRASEAAHEEVVDEEVRFPEVDEARFLTRELPRMEWRVMATVGLVMLCCRL